MSSNKRKEKYAQSFETSKEDERRKKSVISNANRRNIRLNILKKNDEQYQFSESSAFKDCNLTLLM